jgi:4-amino-4-deoxy-L-arabinose transferase-like glycosyltransferase
MINMEKLKHIPRNFFLFILLFILFGVILPICLINSALHVDESTFLVIATRLQNGAVLYKDVANIKNPGIFYLAAMTFTLFGKSYIAVRILTYLTHIGSAIIVYFLGKKIASKEIGMISSILFLIGVYIPQYQGHMYLTETYVVFFMLLSAYFFLKKDLYSKLFSGIFLGLAFVFKQDAVFFAATLLLYYIFNLRYSSNRTKNYFLNSLKEIIFIIMGGAILVAIVFLYFILNGAFDGMIYYTFTSVSGFNHPLGPFIDALIANILPFLPIWLLSISTMLWIIYKFIHGKQLNNTYILLAVWFISFLIPSFYGGSHRMLFIIPSTVLLAAIIIHHLWFFLKQEKNQYILKTFLIITMLLTITIAAISVGYGVVRSGSWTVKDQINAAHTIEPYIDDGKMYTFPFQNYLFLFSNLTPRTKIVGDVHSPEFVEEVIKDLKNYNITYIVAVKDVVEMLNKGEQPSYYPQPKLLLYDFIKENYHPVENVSYYTIFKLNHYN